MRENYNQNYKNRSQMRRARNSKENGIKNAVPKSKTNA